MFDRDIPRMSVVFVLRNLGHVRFRLTIDDHALWRKQKSDRALIAPLLWSLDRICLDF